MDAADFDTLPCFACEAPTLPGRVSAGPVVSYRCACGTSWRINASGERTHERLTAAADAAWTNRILSN